MIPIFRTSLRGLVAKYTSSFWVNNSQCIYFVTGKDAIKIAREYDKSRKGKVIEVGIKEVLESEEFKEALLIAIDKGHDKDWGYMDGMPDEYEFETFDKEESFRAVMKLLRKNLL